MLRTKMHPMISNQNTTCQREGRAADDQATDEALQTKAWSNYR